MYSNLHYCRAVELTEKLDFSSAVALLGFSLILAILRAFNVRDEATRVMISAPLIAFVTTHIMYLNFYELAYGNLLSLNFCSLSHILQSELQNAFVNNAEKRWKTHFLFELFKTLFG